MDIIWFLGAVLVAYLFGSFPTAYLLVWAVCNTDIREHGSCNVGGTNAYRVTKRFRGQTWGLAVFVAVALVDILKGALAVALAQHVTPESLSDWFAVSAMLAVVVGHCYTCWPKLDFKGGKGIATAAGALWVIMPIPFWILLILFLAVYVGSEGVMSLGSVTAAAVLPFVVFGYYGTSRPALLWVLAPVSIFVLWRHKENIKRILREEEPKTPIWKSGRKESP